MPSIHQNPSGVYFYSFRLFGKQFKHTLDTTDEKKARAAETRLNLTLGDIQSGRFVVPAEVLNDSKRLWEYLKTDGKNDTPTRLGGMLVLGDMFDRYFDSLPASSKGENTLVTERIHAEHLKRLLGVKTAVAGITRADVQKYVTARAKEDVRPPTIKKEIATLRMVWNRLGDIIGVAYPVKRPPLDFPKDKEKPPFQTWEQIERNLKALKKPTAEQVEEQWASLFLDVGQVNECLDFMRGRTREVREAYFYPLLVLVAHTGARRSEAARAKRVDFRFDEDALVLREKKKEKARETFRQAEMTPRLKEALTEYFANHPGGDMAFYQNGGNPLDARTLQDTFERAFRGSKWSVVRGYHVFRHSFASNLARAGVDERQVDDLMGHETEAMRKRYRHMFPDARKKAVAKLYG